LRNGFAALSDTTAIARTSVARRLLAGYGPRVKSQPTPSALSHGREAPRRRRVGRWIALSVVLHAPLTPLVGLLGLIDLFGRPEEVHAAPALTEIPLDIAEVQGSPAPPQPATTAPTPTQTEPLPPEPEPVAEPAAAKPAKPTVVAGAEPKPVATASPHVPAEAGKAGRRAAAVTSDAKGEPNANLRVLLHNEAIRRHALGARMDPLLSSVTAWRSLFSATSINPVRDVDRMLILGSQLGDLRNMTLVMELNLPDGQLRSAVDRLVSLDPEGTWTEATVPVASAHADGEERIFVLPSSRTLLVAPPASRAAAEKFSSNSRLAGPREQELASLFLATPWRALAVAGITIPKSILWARLRLTPTDSGGAVIHLVAQDETDAAAKADIEVLERAAKAASKLVLGAALLGAGRSASEAITFSAVDQEIRGEVTLDAAQLETLLSLLQSLLGEQATAKLQ